MSHNLAEEGKKPHVYSKYHDQLYSAVSEQALGVEWEEKVTGCQ